MLPCCALVSLARIIQEIESVFRKKIRTNELISSYPEHHDLDGDVHSLMVRQHRTTLPCHTMRNQLPSRFLPLSFVSFVLFVVHSDSLDVRVIRAGKGEETTKDTKKSKKKTRHPTMACSRLGQVIFGVRDHD